MKAIGIVLFVLAGVMLLVTIFGAVNQARGGTAMDLVRCLQARFGIYFAPGVTWAALGVCCLGLDRLLKKKGEAAASAGDSAAAPARAPKAAARKAAAAPSQPKPAPAPAQAPAPKQATPPVKPAIRPAGDDPAKRNEQNAPGQ